MNNNVREMANLIKLQKHYIELATEHNIMAKGWNNWTRRKQALANKINKAKVVARALAANRARISHGYAPPRWNAKTPRVLANKLKANHAAYYLKEKQIMKNLKAAENKVLRAANYLPGGPKHNVVVAGRARRLERNLAPPTNKNPQGGHLYRATMRSFKSHIRNRRPK